jgi:hypothetical protein
MNDLVKGNRLHQLQNELRNLSVSATEHFCKLGEIMKEIRDNDLWEGQYESFEAFFSDPEFSFKKSSVYHSIRLVEVIPQWKELTDVPVSKLIMVVPHLESGDKDKLITQARTLSTGDLYQELNQLKSGKEQPEYYSMPRTYPCDVCHLIKGIKFKDLCHCGWTDIQKDTLQQAIDKIERGIL